MQHGSSAVVGLDGAEEFARESLDRYGTRLVVGVDGSGRSAMLAEISERAAQVDRPVFSGDPIDAPAGSVVLVDDAHLASDRILDRLAAAATRSDISLVIATAPRRYDCRIETLISAAGPHRLTLTPLNKAAIGVRAARWTRPISAPLAGVIGAATGGVLAAVDCAVHALASPDDAGAPPTKTVTDAVAAYHRRLLMRESEDVKLLLLAALFGMSPDPSTASQLLRATAETETEALVDRAWSSGLLTPTGTTLAAVEAPLVDTVGHRLRGLLGQVAAVGLACRVLDASTARALAEHGVVDPDLARLLVAEADTAPVGVAADLYAGAVAAGFDASALAARRAEVAAATGDLDAAGAFADAVLERSEACEVSDLRTAVRVSATVAAERGMSTRSAHLYGWLGTERAGPDVGFAALLAAGVGDRHAAEQAVAAAAALPPTTGTAAATLVATGLIDSIDARTVAAANTAANALMRAVSLAGSSPERAVAPDSPAAVAAMSALHMGDLARAESVLNRGIAQEPPGTSAHTRLTLIGAWTSMLRGDATEANRLIASVTIPESHTRNQLVRRALDVGLARRSGDTGALISAWTAAQDVVAEYSVDLFALLPLGELLLAATRLGQRERIEHLLTEADALLACLGDPPAWSASLHWYHVQAAITAQTPDALVPHARALAAAAPTHPYCAALAAAGGAWLGVLQDRPDADAVTAAARTLCSFGLSWDGARLASEAALRVTDTATATTLLHVARSLRQPSPAVRETAEVGQGRGGTTTAPARNGASSGLSDREAEVAELLVLGVTYRELGSRLYISPKTVEHHVARIRRRLGARSRSDLISMLRAMGYGNSAGSTGT